jgi:hypothetical protein
MEETEKTLFRLSLDSLEGHALKVAKSNKIGLDPLAIDILTEGHKLLGDDSYKVPDPTKMCTVCNEDLESGIEIICSDCFHLAFTEHNWDPDPEIPERYAQKKYLQFVADMAVEGILVE